MIPKIIHYCWLSGDPYPKLVANCIASWKKYLPDWEFRLWDKECLKEIDEPWVHEAYEAKVYSHAADYIRLYAVYNYGGFYLDSDVEVLKDLSPLLHHHYVFGLENGTGCIEAAVIGAEPGCEVLKESLNFYHGKHFVNDNKSLFKIMVPRVLRDTLKDFIVVTDEKMYTPPSPSQVLSQEFFSPLSYLTGKYTDLTERSYTIHHFMSSWVPLKTKLYIFTYRLLGDNLYNKMFKIKSRVDKIWHKSHN